MKNYRALAPIVMIVMILASWYVLVSDSIKVEKVYNEYLRKARTFADDGVTKYAMENYNMALEIKSSPEIYAEVAEYYKGQKKDAEYLSWCEDFFEEYPTQPKAYECLLDAYLMHEDYKSCYDVLETATKRNVSSKKIKKVTEDIMYVYKLDFNSYDDVAIYSNNYCPVKSNEVWGFVDRFGNQRIACKYLEVGAYTQSNFTSVVNTDKDAYFIDKEGSKVLVSKKKYQSFGLLVDGKIAAKTTDDKYVYVDQDFNVLFGEYDYASTFNNGVAAIKKGNDWKLIDENGKNLTDKKYIDVILDEKKIAYRNDRLFVSASNNQYIMINGSGKRIGKLEFEDARVFNSEEPAAVKIGSKWCFVDSDGKKISNKTYDDARSFSNGLAAVCIDGKWGFVDLEENIVIEPKFFDAKDFNEKGSCFVKTGDKWQLLKLYRLNRED